jgi:hypothetical protein
MINDFRACKFDPRSRVCKASGKGDASCLTKKQAGRWPGSHLRRRAQFPR